MKNNRNRLINNSLFYILLFVVLVLAASWFAGGQSTDQSKTLSQDQFITQLKQGKVKSFKIEPIGGAYQVTGNYKKAQTSNTTRVSLLGRNSSSSSKVTQFTSTVLPNNDTLKQINNAAMAKDVKTTAAAKSQSSQWVYLIISFVVPLVLIFFVFFALMGRGGQGGGGANRVMSFGKSKVKPEDPKKNKVRFSDVAGAEEEKQELVEVVDFLKDPRKYVSLGARIPSGVLLEGPPGTGKTLLAKAVAGEAKVPFYSISGSDFVEMFVGVGASRVRDLFENAKKDAPSIIFIDEIDAVGRQRGAGTGGGNDEREQTLNQLLIEMDGFTGNEGVIVMAATNRSDVLDPALLRPGRFDRKILVGRPDVKGREAILKVHSKNKTFTDDVDLKVIAQQTPGFVGADLENLLNEAALVAARRHKTKIDSSDIDEAEDRVIAGPAKKNRVISDKERHMVAYHEAGHALIGLVLNDSRVVRKVTIVPRGRAGGYAIMLPKDDQNLVTKKELTEQITGLLGGRTAEEIIFGQQSSGASNDFEQATNIARTMVTEYGMTDRLGTVQLEKDGQPVGSGGYRAEPTYSQDTAKAIDQEVKRIIDEAHEQAREIIESHRDQHKLIAEALLKYETLDEKEILSLFNTGKMPANDKNEQFPSESAATFEQAKRAAEAKDAAKQKSEDQANDHDDSNNSDDSGSDNGSGTSDVEKPDDVSNDSDNQKSDDSDDDPNKIEFPSEKDDNNDNNKD
ncbi:ATP-dependent zinc metalloprotease FtsH [Companilactobacillus sp.]|jgi:cell division protease FtsH|uniref:ATP-dependent zinc metalloprotease FtsH n=1 Tax=Companilactobacillus sp. TaxID=2767905 RepID=UPI0025C5E152|nr:ATP-dependent zinc metalloprotease FtsH [Companilactobacillus sp.]MCH4010158.1 ATP-dependent zinc metalloprotease FtsH [Companilactobacillus sp.]MCH4052166.1 ATP-dependent zinc metalloprotease FtsH [Companilactobacillus sp.]MCH4078100.1 ATP-dependent zinc metalloprotease FtsH [Companilactobacillus sp.]MCH4126676.1 ATP-dependent zinc metalloprotease FtsH [Companilactobacillus sp.]MCH4132261.1 ATP-dependent zinc metalloprotease FtsH [Companilactobacillus sp.]